MEKVKKLSPQEAGEILGMSDNTVRRGMRQGVLPIGCVIKNGSRDSYFIYEDKLKEYIYGTSKVAYVNALDMIMAYVNRL